MIIYPPPKEKDNVELGEGDGPLSEIIKRNWAWTHEERKDSDTQVQFKDFECMIIEEKH